MDSITEIIAHFIGVFSIQMERAKMREDYDEFNYQARYANDPGLLGQVTISVNTDYDLNGAKAKVDYEHQWPNYPPLPQDFLDFTPPDTPDPALFAGQDLPYSDIGSAGFSAEQPAFYFDFSFRFSIQPAGSVAVVIGQDNQLLDRDIVTNTALNFDPLAYSAFETQLDFLQQKATQLMPLAELMPPGNEDAIMAIIEDAAETLKSLRDDPIEVGEGTLLLGEDTSGIHTNGVSADAMADFAETIERHRGEDKEGAAEPAKQAPNFDENGAPDATGTNEPVTATGDAVETNGSQLGANGDGGYDISTGNNELYNQAGLTDAWTGAPVMAVLGNHISLQIVMQANVWQNSDHGGYSKPTDDLAINTAAITSSSTAAPFTAADVTDGDPVFPQNWAIAKLETNLVSLNWLEQFNEVYDEDIVSWEHGGSQLFLQMGGNASANFVSLVEFGLQYDLIIISGSVFQANIIEQSNILLDDDRIAKSDWTEADGDAIASSGNLLWNAASIHTVGQTTFESLPGSYLKAATDLKDGGDDLNQAILDDGHFDGVDFLNVLYINGNFLDLNYFKQTNVLSDADQIELTAGFDDAAQTIDTGDNLLANFATIIDLGTDATAYVGGEVYSDALLYQANLVEETAPLNPSAPQDLASEAVLFLADGMLSPSPEEAEDLIVATSSTEIHTVDVMQSVTG